MGSMEAIAQREARMGKKKSDKLPWMKFFPADYLRDTRSLTLGANGAWINLICYMWDAPQRGSLAYTIQGYSRLFGATIDGCRAVIDELTNPSHPICDREDLPDGTIRLTCRRMVRDQQQLEKSKKYGRMGGNPKLGVEYNRAGFVYLMRRSDGMVKVGISVNPSARASKLRQSEGDPDIAILATKFVNNMGEEERTLHSTFSDCERDGEWFSINDNRLSELRLSYFSTLKGIGKGNNEKVRSPSTSDSNSDSSEEFREDLKEGYPVIPGPLQTPEFISAWSDYISHRQEIKHSLTPTAVRNLFLKMLEWGNDRAVIAIRHSISSGWQGVFEPKNNQQAAPSPQSAAERMGEKLRAGMGAKS